VENVLYALPEVADAAVIGVPDAKWGESGLAFIVIKADYTLDPDAILTHCRANLAKFKVPQAVRFIDALPRNAAGKVLKRELKTLVDES
jgi:fatty-acyl-CoA synthase